MIWMELYFNINNKTDGYAERLSISKYRPMCRTIVPCVIVGRDENDTIIFFMDFPK